MSFLYTVYADFTDPFVAEEYVRWLTTEGHMAHVIAAGATAAQVVRVETPGITTVQLQVMYWFADARAFGQYEQEHAPALRAEGAKRFPPSRGVTLRRATATVLGGAGDEGHP